MYKIEFTMPGSYGSQILFADSVSALIERLIGERKFPLSDDEAARMLKWEKDDSAKRLYGYGPFYTLQRGETEMTEYTSF